MECSITVRNRKCKLKPTKQLINDNSYLCTRHAKGKDCNNIVLTEPQYIPTNIIDSPLTDSLNRIYTMFSDDNLIISDNFFSDTINLFDTDNDNPEYAASQKRKKDEANMTAQTFTQICDSHDSEPEYSSTSTKCIICLDKVKTLYTECENCHTIAHEDCLNLWKKFKNKCPICKFI